MNGNSRILLEKGTLWEKIVKSTQKALRIGAQFPIPTEYEFIEDRGVKFFVRIISHLKMKYDALKKQEVISSSKKESNPFLPYDKDMFVADISDTHVALLNKFNVVEHHLLIVTKHFEDQETLLTLNDFRALWACMLEYNGLGFYNGGKEAGASQPHKHLQMVPLPLTPKGPDIPIEPFIISANFKNGFGLITQFPFQHVLVLFKDDILASPLHAAKKTFELYSLMLEHIALEPPSNKSLKKQSKPYCLLISRKWMLLVPRSKEFFNSISINSLGYAGALLVHNKEQLNLLKETGPLNVLKSVSLPFNRNDKI